MASCEKDQKVLDFMFDPYLIGYNVMSNDGDHSINLNQSDLNDEQFQSKKLELEAVELANQNKLNDSLKLLDQCLTIWSRNASALNNRAQVYRLMNRLVDAKSDLDQAIQLSDGQHENVQDKLVARQAYCQRALIYLLNNKQEQGLRDMTRSAELGNRFARSYMAKMNPYAALCNQMLQNMFKQFTTTTKQTP